MQTTKKISLEKLFPQDDCYWKVAWVDGLVDKLNEREPQLRVFLSQLKSNLSSNEKPLNPINLVKNAHKVITIGVGHQNLIYIGSVWLNGRDISYQFKYDEFTFELNTSLAQNITLSENSDKGRRIIPPQQYPIGSKFDVIKDSNLLALEFDGRADGFLIPVSEIIRFYYLVTTCMALSVYFGRFSDLFQNNFKFDTVNRNVEFSLNWGVSERNVVTIARYISSKLTKDRVDEVHRFVQANSLNNAEAPSNLRFFPFDGPTTITCEGHTIYGDDNVQRFLCTRLISCNGEMGFDSVKATKIVSELLKKDLDEETQNLNYMWPLYSDASEDQILLDEEPSKNHLSKTFANHEIRHPNLIGKLIETNKKHCKSEKARNIISDKSEGKRSISTSSGTYAETNTRKAKIEYDLSVENSVIPPRFQIFIDCLNHLKSDGWEIKLCRVEVPPEYKNEHDSIAVNTIGQLTVMGLFNAGIAVKNKSWAETTYGKKVHHRGLAIAEVRRFGHYWYLYELEPNKSEQNDSTKGFSLLVRYVINKSALSNRNLYVFMRSCVINMGWPKRKNEDKAFFRELRLNHKSGLKERLIIKMKNQMMG